MLMEGDTNDLTRNSECIDFVSGIYEMMSKLEGSETTCPTTKDAIVRCIGVKRTNANDLSSIGLNGGVALYPTYPFMNHHCYCNARYTTKTSKMRYVGFV
jgi:hypothetical protein